MMGSSKHNTSSRRWGRMGLAALIGFAVVIGGNGMGFAADDDDELPDTKFLRSIMKGLGLKKDGESGIEYRERSPLVLPPARDLPAPAAADSKKTAAWPVDPDIKRAKERKAASKKPLVYNADAEEGARPALPSELNRPNAPVRRDSGGPMKSAEESEAPSTQKELGTKNIFSKMWGPSEEYTTFSGEPARGSLTEPPRGYRTPSPHQPYGVGKEKWKPGTQEKHVDPR